MPTAAMPCGWPATTAATNAAGVNIDQQNGNGASALMYVSSNSKPDLVKLLLEKGANPKLKNFDDSTALDLAASLECLKLLRKAA